MSLSACVLDPSCQPTDVREWGFGEDHALVTGHLGGPEVASRLRADLAEDSHLVVLHRPSEEGRAAFLANVISGAVPALPVTRLVVGSSLLAATLVTLEAARVEGDGDPARLARVARTLGHTVSGAWLKRVTRLTTPSPSFGQHLRSVIPGGPGFVARTGADGRVTKAAPGGYGAGGTGRLVVGADRGQAGVQRLLDWFGTGDVLCVPPVVEDVKAAYGNAGVEFAVIDEVLAAPGPQRGRCRVCREPLHHDSCPFCHVRPELPEVIPV